MARVVGKSTLRYAVQPAALAAGAEQASQALALARGKAVQAAAHGKAQGNAGTRSFPRKVSKPISELDRALWGVHAYSQTAVETYHRAMRAEVSSLPLGWQVYERRIQYIAAMRAPAEAIDYAMDAASKAATGETSENDLLRSHIAVWCRSRVQEALRQAWAANVPIEDAELPSMAALQSRSVLDSVEDTLDTAVLLTVVRQYMDADAQKARAGHVGASQRKLIARAGVLVDRIMDGDTRTEALAAVKATTAERRTLAHYLRNVFERVLAEPIGMYGTGETVAPWTIGRTHDKPIKRAARPRVRIAAVRAGMHRARFDGRARLHADNPQLARVPMSDAQRAFCLTCHAYGRGCIGR